MQELTEWARSIRFPVKPWLILGKGPTFSQRNEFDLSSYNLISLNHAVVQQRVDIAHVVDLDVIDDCGEALLRNSRFVVLPRHPHLMFRPTAARLEDFVTHIPVLAELDRDERLIWYNAATGPRDGDAPVVDLRYFSSEAALGIVAHLGATTVRSLGVDGSRSYSAAFDSYRDKTLLQNDQPSFNPQFRELDRIAAKHGVQYRPLIGPLRIFVGVDPAQRVAAEVLEHSLHAHASVPIRVDHLDQQIDRTPRDPRSRPRTPFSFNRFLIPSLMGYEGSALYLDSDMLVFDDVAELFSLPFGSHSVLCTNQPSPPAEWRNHPDFKAGRQFSVMLIDCERARWDLDDVISKLDSGALSYEDLMFDLALVPPAEIGDTIPDHWNHLERFVPGETKLLHYTVVPTQPWRSTTNPLRPLWLDAFRGAVEVGAVDRGALITAARDGLVEQDLVDLAEGVESPPVPELSPSQIEIRALRQQVQLLGEGRDGRGDPWRRPASAVLKGGSTRVRRLWARFARFPTSLGGPSTRS